MILKCIIASVLIIFFARWAFNLKNYWEKHYKPINSKLILSDNDHLISNDCNFDIDRIKQQGIITYNFDQKPIGKFGNIKKIGNEIFVEAIVSINSEGQKLIETGLKSGIIKLAPGGEVKYNDKGEISEFKIYEISLVSS